MVLVTDYKRIWDSIDDLFPKESREEVYRIIDFLEERAYTINNETLFPYSEETKYKPLFLRLNNLKNGSHKDI